mmetsp:Transcript_23872/g.40841  ORF Transcript_23872/g.40841 Transcript_23872/m.40841 type:complete len:251 (-) Transcript_23872:383-1135(-)
MPPARIRPEGHRALYEPEGDTQAVRRPPPHQRQALLRKIAVAAGDSHTRQRTGRERSHNPAAIDRLRRHARAVLRRHEHFRTERPPLGEQSVPVQRRLCRSRLLQRRGHLNLFAVQAVRSDVHPPPSGKSRDQEHEQDLRLRGRGQGQVRRQDLRPLPRGVQPHAAGVGRQQQSLRHARRPPHRTGRDLIGHSKNTAGMRAPPQRTHERPPLGGSAALPGKIAQQARRGILVRAGHHGVVPENERPAASR